MRSSRSINLFCLVVLLMVGTARVADAAPLQPELNIRVGGRMDSNIYRRTLGLSDYVGVIRPNLGLKVPFSQITLGEFHYSLDWDQYKDNPFVNTRNHDLFLSLQHRFSKTFSLSLWDGLSRSNLPDALDDQNGFIYDYWQNASGVDGSFRVSPTMLFKGSYTYQNRAYLDRMISPGSNVKQRDQRHNLGSTLVKQLGRHTVGALAYQYRLNRSNDDYFDYTNHRMSALFTRDFSLAAPVQLLYRFEHRNYPRQVEGLVRHDSRHTVLLSATVPLTPWMALRGSYAFQVNRSNVRDYKVRLGSMNLVFSWGGGTSKKVVRSFDAATYYKLGIYYTKEKDFDKSVTAFKRAIDLNPKDARSYANLGFAYIAQRDFPQALTACQQAVQLDPTLVAAHTNLGIAYYKTGNVQAAIKEWQKAFELDPTNVQVQALLTKLGN